MRIFILTFALVAVSACQSEAPAAPAKPAPEAKPVAAAQPAANAPTPEAYIKAAIRIACAGKNLTDSSKLAEEVAAAQKESGFDVQSWTAMAQQVARDSAATRRISDGAASCE